MIFFICTTMSSYSVKLYVSAWAKVRAFSSRYSRWSMTITRPAPISQADLAANSPTGPAPKTTTTSPSTMSPSWAPK